jgi:predicted nucleotidyltransferase
MKKTSVRKNEQEFEWTTTYLVMGHFFKYPRIDFTLSEVAQATNLSKSTVSAIINNLRNAGFVRITDLGIVYRITANPDSWIYRREKIIYNFANVVRSDIVEHLVNKYKNPKCILLFGSYRKGEDDEDSDIDIAVEVTDGEETGEFHLEGFKLFEDFAKRKVVVHVFTRKQVNNNVFMGIANGIVLHGLLEARK